MLKTSHRSSLINQLAEVSGFLDPVFINTLVSTARWKPTERWWRCRSSSTS